MTYKPDFVLLIASSSNLMASVRVAPQRPEDIFPLEVWGLILDHLRSPSDLINCNQTCKAWAKLLELRRTTFLMPQVFPLLYMYLGPTTTANEEDENNPINIPNQEEEEEQKEYAKLHTVLQMRLVSHSWKKSVDAYYQDHDAMNDMGFLKQVEDDDGCDPSDIPLRPYTFGIDNVAKLESWVQKDFPPDCNPFITRYVVYEDNSEQYDLLARFGERRVELEQLQRQLRTSFKALLESFGSQIWTVELSFTTTDCSRIELYRLVRSYLILMPNLKAIDFSGPSNELEETGTSFKELLRMERMPELEHLKILFMSPITLPISIGILSQNPKLRKLCVDTHDREVVALNSIGGIELPELEQLSVAPALVSKVDLSNVQNLVWRNLKGLLLTVEEKQLKDVFGAVSTSTFSSSLEHFILILWNGYVHIENDMELEQPEWQIVQLDQQLEGPAEQRLEQLERRFPELEQPEQRLEQPEWQLEQLHQQLWVPAQQRLEQLERLFPELEQVDQQLEVPAEQRLEQLERLLEQPERHLEPPEQQLLLKQPEQQLELCKLKKFELNIRIPFELETIDFLLGCPNLQEINLDIKISRKEYNTSNSVIQFKDCIASMQDSNIWQLLPMLKRLEIKTTGIEGVIRRGMTVFPKKTYTFTRGENGKITSS